jgi:presenilin-like A22 family membrane protease
MVPEKEGGVKIVTEKRMLPMLGIGLMMIISILLAVLIAGSFSRMDLVAFEEPSDPMNLAWIIGALVFVTFLFLFLSSRTHRSSQHILKVIIYFSITLLVFYGYLGLMEYILPIETSALGAIMLALFTGIFLWIYPEWYVIDISGVVAAGTAAALFGISIEIPYILLLLLVFAIYDWISVYRTKHMINIAKSSLRQKLPLMLIAPRNSKYSFRRYTAQIKNEEEQIKDFEEQDNQAEKRVSMEPEGEPEGELQDKEAITKRESLESRKATFVGLGDVAIPTILPVGVLYWRGEPALFAFTIGGIFAGYFLLSYFVLKGKPQAGLPFLNGGAILGFLIGLAIF